MRKVEAATFQGQLYLWATISRFSHTNEYVVKENNRPLSRRGMAPSAWVLRLSIGPSTPAFTRRSRHKMSLWISPNRFKSSATGLDWHSNKKELRVWPQAFALKKKTRLRAFDLWVTSATLGAQVYKAVVLEPTWPGITSSHYPWKFQKTKSQNSIFNETITAFLSGTMGAWLNFHFGWQDKEIFFKSLCFHVVCIMLNTEWRDLWIDEWKSMDIVVMHPLSFVESPQKRKYFLARGTESTGLSGVAKVAEL